VVTAVTQGAQGGSHRIPRSRGPGTGECDQSEDPGSKHTYTQWAGITQEVINARLWDGIHFRFSDDTGARVGIEVASYDLLHLGSMGL
jgi:hypothetical protein